MVKINLGILNLFKGLVDGVRSKPLDGGGHLGVEGVLKGLALPLIDLLNLGLILSVREGGAGRPDGADLWSSQTYFDRRGKTCRLCSGRTGWRDRL